MHLPVSVLGRKMHIFEMNLLLFMLLLTTCVDQRVFTQTFGKVLIQKFAPINDKNIACSEHESRLITVWTSELTG